MAMWDYVLSAYRFNLWLVKKGVEDLTDAQMCMQPGVAGGAGMNHAAWVVGHLAMDRVFLKPFLGLTAEMPEAWVALFMTGTKPVAEVGKYPKKEALVAELEETHRVVEEGFLRMAEADFEKETPNERMRAAFPKVGDLVVGLMTAHAGNHFGQLSAWRRAMGFKSVF